jgi:subtilisin family serine protease
MNINKQYIKKFTLPIILTITIILATTLTAAAINPIPETPDKTELLLRFKPGVTENFKRKLLTTFELEIVEEIHQIQTIIVRVPEKALQQVKNALSHNPMIDFVEENRQIPPSAIPNDPYYTKQWHLTKIGAPEAWKFSIGKSDVIIAVLDSGVDPNHPDLAAKLLPGYNFYDNNYNTSDVYGHGTKVAGVAAAITNNALGVAGIAWQCSILPVRVTDTDGYTSYSLLSKGLIYAADHGAKTATISFQIYGGKALSSAAKYFMDKGGLVVGAGGNTGQYCNDTDNPYIISVSATTSTDTITSWSTYGPYIDLAAPGSSIYTTFKGGGYGSASGTSFSTPIVAGLAALIFSANPNLTPTQVEQILKSTAVDLGSPGYDIYYGWGRINASKALRMAAGTPPPPQDTTPPNVAITYPKDGATVSASITVTVNASDNVAVSKVELYKNGELFAVDNEAPYEFYWDTTCDPDGQYTLYAKAYDSSGNVATSNTITVKVANTPKEVNPPTINIIQPINGSTVSKIINITVSAYGESGISKVEFYINDKLLATDTTEPYTYRWNTRSVKDGWQTITAKAYDSLGNMAQTSIKVYVSNKKQ